MLRVLIELLPHGNPLTKRTLATMEIANIHTDPDGRFANYRYVLSDESFNKTGEPNLRVVGYIRDHDRMQQAHVLVRKCLEHASSKGKHLPKAEGE